MVCDGLTKPASQGQMLLLRQWLDSGEGRITYCAQSQRKEQAETRSAAVPTFKNTELDEFAACFSHGTGHVYQAATGDFRMSRVRAPRHFTRQRNRKESNVHFLETER